MKWHKLLSLTFIGAIIVIARSAPVPDPFGLVLGDESTQWRRLVTRNGPPKPTKPKDPEPRPPPPPPPPPPRPKTPPPPTGSNTERVGPTRGVDRWLDRKFVWGEENDLGL